MVDRQKAFSFLSSRGYYQRFSPSQIFDTLWTGFESELRLCWMNLSSSDNHYIAALQLTACSCQKLCHRKRSIKNIALKIFHKSTGQHPYNSLFFNKIAGLRSGNLFWKKTLQSFTKYLRLTLVYMWNSALQQRFNFCFSTVFC